MITISICAVIAVITLLKIAYDFEKSREALEDISQELNEINMKD